jgi:hypothetical protein
MRFSERHFAPALQLADDSAENITPDGDGVHLALDAREEQLLKFFGGRRFELGFCIPVLEPHLAHALHHLEGYHQ